MILLSTEQYALRVASLLALTYSSHERLRARDIAEKTSIPQAYVSKILRRLVVARLVVAEKGHHGGFVLNRDPGEITFAQVLSAVGTSFDDEECVFGFSRCDNDDPCPLHDHWSKLKQDFVGWAEKSTLKEISESKPGGKALKRKKA